MLEVWKIKPPELSPKQIRVLQLVHRGIGNRMIAAQLGVTPGAIAGILGAIKRKYRAENRTQILDRTYHHPAIVADRDKRDREREERARKLVPGGLDQSLRRAGIAYTKTPGKHAGTFVYRIDGQNLTPRQVVMDYFSSEEAQ